jgi:phenylacetate-coenzyme A ligase PaaK-like adenylate-forming protein
MPMIRYEQGDIVTLGKTCDTGISWPIIKSVNGRVRSYIDGPNGERKLLTLFTADFLLMREIQDFRLVKFNDQAVFIAQTRDELTDEQNLRIVKSLQNDVFRGDQRIRILTQRENLRTPKWKVREIYLLDMNSDPNWKIEEIDKFLEESEIVETSGR